MPALYSVSLGDMRKVVKCVTDPDSMFELKPRFGRSMVTSFARIDGRSVGIIANNPMFKGGSIDVDACRKVTSFLVLSRKRSAPIAQTSGAPHRSRISSR